MINDEVIIIFRGLTIPALRVTTGVGYYSGKNIGDTAQEHLADFLTTRDPMYVEGRYTVVCINGVEPVRQFVFDVSAPKAFEIERVT